MQIQCPSCAGLLEVDDHLSGQVVACGHCDAHIRVPAAVAASPAASKPRATGPRPPAPRTPSPARKQAAALGARMQAAASEARAEADTDLAARPKKRKKKRKSLYRGDDYNEDSANVWIGVACGVLGWAALLGLTFLWHGFLWVHLVGGAILTSIGRRWFLGIAAEEGIHTWLMCLFVPFYSTYYFFTRFSDTFMPFLLGALGYLFLITGGIFFYYVEFRNMVGEFGEVHEAFAKLEGTFTFDWKGKATTIPMAGLFYSAQPGRNTPSSKDIALHGAHGTTLYAELPAGFKGDWADLAGKSLRIRPFDPDENEDPSHVYRHDEDDGLQVSGGTVEVTAVEGGNEKPILRGRITLEIKGQKAAGNVTLPIVKNLDADDE